ncbi:MAG: DUF5126 domain-containing protein [Bacteroidales bacterium]|nr:DUF5126 domain-containing protein [Bacteroidales bacterium]
MNKMKIFFSSCLILIALGYCGCKEEGRLDQENPDAPAPVPLTADHIKEVKAIPGGTIVKYRVPLDENLSYVKASYEIAPGNIKEAKASKYIDSLSLEGFSTAGTYKVIIHTVGENQKESDPYELEVNPLTPPVLTAFSTLSIKEMFGGIRGSFENPDKASLAVVVMADTLDIGLWSSLRTFYFGLPKVSFSHNGMSPKETKFGVYLRDRWGNKSDTLVEYLTPKFEEEIPKNATNYSSGFKKHTLPSDEDEHVEGPGYALEKLWDGITSDVNSNIFAGLHGIPMPRTFTISIGCEAIISRIVVHQRKDYEYTGAGVKKFKLYGSNADKPGDSLAPGGDWILLGDFESVIPSGSATPTEDDKIYANQRGENFELIETPETPDPWVPVKYIRFQAIETFEGGKASQIIIAEISLHGQVQNKDL